MRRKPLDFGEFSHGAEALFQGGATVLDYAGSALELIHSEPAERGTGSAGW